MVARRWQSPVQQGDRPEIAFGNDLPTPMVVNWRGLDGISAAEPLISRRPTAPGNGDTIELPLRHAGTLLCDLAMLGDGATLPTRALPLIVTEREVTTADHDEVLLIEDWRLRADGTAIAPGADPGDTVPTYTVNGQANWEIKLRTNERVRVRFINGLQRNVIAIKIEGYKSWIMAIDGQPAEPFLARGGGLILAPGSRADVFIDATARPAGTTSSILLHDGKAARPIGRLIASSEPPIRDALLPAARPLPSNGLPARLDLKAALRIDLTLGASATEWVAPAKFAATAPPAFRTKAGRTVVLGLTNRSEVTTVFHLHGHHFRLLDRLDDGWKPFWLDTLSIDAGQTQRVAFAAEFAGRWLIEFSRDRLGGATARAVVQCRVRKHHDPELPRYSERDSPRRRRADLTAAEKCVWRYRLGTSRPDRYHHGSGAYRTILHLCLRQADA